MKKFIVILILLIPSITFCQKYPDHIITKNQEFINCKILTITDKFVYFSYSKKGIKTDSNMPMDSVQTIYQKNNSNNNKIPENIENYQLKPKSDSVAKTTQDTTKKVISAIVATEIKPVIIQKKNNGIKDSLTYLYNQVYQLQQHQKNILNNFQYTNIYLHKAGVNSIISLSLMVLGAGLVGIGTYANSQQLSRYSSDYNFLYYIGGAVSLSGIVVGVIVPFNLLKAGSFRN